MEVAGYVGHYTTFVRPRNVAQVRYFKQLLNTVSSMHCCHHLFEERTGIPR